MKPTPITAAPQEERDEFDEASDHADEHDSGALSDLEARRVERLANGIGKLTVDGVGALAAKLAASRSPIAGLLSHCVQEAIAATFRRGQGQRAP